MKNTKLIIFLFLVLSLYLSASDKKHSLTIQESAFPLIPSMSEFRYTLTKNTPFGLDFIDTAELSFWYTADTFYFAPSDFIEVGTLYQASLYESEILHIDMGIGTACSASFDAKALSVPFIGEFNLDYYMEPHFFISTEHYVYIYGEGFIYKTRLPITYELLSGNWSFYLGPGFNYGYSSARDYSAWAITVNLGASFRWGTIK